MISIQQMVAIVIAIIQSHNALMCKNKKIDWKKRLWSTKILTLPPANYLAFNFYKFQFLNQAKKDNSCQ